MPEKNTVKALHLAKGIEELQKNANIPNSVKPNLLAKSASKVFTEATNSFEDGDEEKAYILFYKYVNMYKLVRKSKEYQKDKSYYDLMMTPKNAKFSMERLEELDKNLTERYDVKKHEDAKKKILIEDRIFDRVDHRQQNGGGGSTPKENRVKSATDQKQHHNESSTSEMAPMVIEASQLYSLLEQKSTTLLLLDARPSDHYKNSHIKSPSSLSIPEDILKPGTTVKVIDRNLHVESRSQWSRRTKIDQLILFDWSSEEFNEGTPLDVLKKAMFHFDKYSGTSYKSPAYILKGGFDHFALSYPMWVTDPQKSRPPTANTRANNISDINIENLEYPDLNKGFIKTPDDSPAAAVSSGAITMSNRGMEAMNSPTRTTRLPTIHTSTPLQPKIPDRNSKPKEKPYTFLHREKSASPASSVSSAISSSEMSDATLNKAIVVDDSINSVVAGPLTTIKAPPKFDRNLKSNMVNKEMKHIDDVLEAENEIVEDSIRREKKQLDLEKEWELLSLKKKNNINEEMTQHFRQREEELIEELEKLNLEKNDKDQENKKLRKELDDIKAEFQKKDEDFILAEKLRANKTKELEMKQNVDKLRKERKDRLKQEQLMIEQHKRNEEARRIRIQTEKEIHSKINKVPLKLDMDSARRLSRSNSSPNIAKMLEDEDSNVSVNTSNIPTPKFDRTYKSSLENRGEIKNRNFGSNWGTSKKGLTGLRNLGNTCYMNSLLQCLSNFTYPSQYFIGDSFKNDLNRSSDTNGEIAIEFAEVVRTLWSGQYKSIAPSEFKRTIGKYNEMFRGSDQQDAHELLMFLMEYLNQDVNEIRCKVKLPEQNNDNIPEMEAAKRAWEMEQKADRSFIRQTFYGQQRSTLRCPHCGWTSVTYESFFELPLKLPHGNKRCSIKQLIETYLSIDNVPYKCPTCKRERECEKKFEIVKLPLILTISLGRFYNDGLSRKKQNFVDFDLRDVNFGQFATGCNGQLNRYKDYHLYGISNHFGSLESGHYTAYCYSQVYTNWYKYDDTEVYEMDASDVKSPAAYILFYSAKN